MKTAAKWTGAIVLSLLAHAGGAALLRPGPEEVLVAGGEVTEIALLGNAFEDVVEAGDPETIDPIDEIEPAEIEPVEEEIPAETVEAIQPTVADVTVPIEDLTPVMDEKPMVTAALSPVEEIEPIEEPEPEKVIPEKKPEPKKVEKKPAPKKIVRKKPGVKSEATQAMTKGKEDGVENGTSAKATGNARASAQQAGNAAVSNYPGKVRSKLTRAIRYPSAASRERLRGTALVRFTVSSGGGVSGISLAKSAGSSILDEAALATVSRAAPFPKIPDGAGRNSWTFTVPVSFQR